MPPALLRALAKVRNLPGRDLRLERSDEETLRLAQRGLGDCEPHLDRGRLAVNPVVVLGLDRREQRLARRVERGDRFEPIPGTVMRRPPFQPPGPSVVEQPPLVGALLVDEAAEGDVACGGAALSSPALG